MATMNLPAFTEEWLRMMDRKDHPSWHLLARGGLEKRQLLVHYQQEWLAYVCDFPVMLARVLGKGPPAPVRRALAENIFEEQTGRLSGEDAHPELFLEMMSALGFPRDAFVEARMLPSTNAYRAWLDHATLQQDWLVGFAVMCIFVEGSAKERVALGLRPSPTPLPGSVHEAVVGHPLVRHYGVPPAAMRLTRAHYAVEGNHRDDAWRIVVELARTDADRAAVTSALNTSLELWRLYRDGVARAMGLSRAA